MRRTWIVFLSLCFTIRLSRPILAQTPADWYMTAANSQRTSHNSVEIPGDLKPVWYRSFDPYIDPKVQVIAANNQIFISTARGLYAFEAGNGNQQWVYGTELPLGNSPTYFNGILYVGGYDHKIHAINAANGSLKSNWSFVNAGAGFDTNPLVVSDSHTGNQTVVLAGNRDGYFYALNGNDGTQKWRVQTAGPIHLSAAYKNGVVYFASDDRYAYALDVATGAQVWKSGPFPGVGFDWYWPVVYTDTYPSSQTYQQDFVIFAGSLKASRWACHASSPAPYGCQIHTPNYELYSGKPGCTATTSQSYLWASGMPTLSCDTLYDYFNNNPKWGTQKPWWRTTFILNRTTGVEQTPYAPFNPSGFDGDNQGFYQPPVVGGDGVLYQRIGTGNGGNGGCSGWINGWMFGSKYVSRIASESAACDEPSAFTSGGNLIYYGEGSFNHEGFGTIDTNVTTPNDTKWSGSVNIISRYTENSLQGKYGSTNGAYSYMDGFLNFSPIPYGDKLYLINGNVLYALKSTGTATQPLNTVVGPPQLSPASIPTTRDQVQARLINEVQKMLTAGHLRPGYYSSGLTSQTMQGAYDYPIPGESLEQYFENPAETVIALTQVLDYIQTQPQTPALQSLVTPIKNYLQTHYGPGAPYDFTQYASIGWKNGAQREPFTDIPEFSATINESYDVNYALASAPRTCIWAFNNLKIATPATANCWMNDQAKSGFPPENLYAGWRYALHFPGTSAALFNSLRNKLSVAGSGNDMTNANLAKFPYIHNQYLIAYLGYVELDKMANSLSSITQSNRYAEYQRLADLRWTSYSKDSPYSRDENVFVGTFNAARNFMYLTPELGDLMQANIPSQAQATVDQYQLLTPSWFIAKSAHSGPESYGQPLYNTPALFQARAYILDYTFAELVKYLDIPAFDRGDLYYIQNLVALLQAPGNSVITPSPTPTTDLNHDGVTDCRDYLRLILDFNSTQSYDFLGSPLIDIFDVNYLVNNLN